MQVQRKKASKSAPGNLAKVKSKTTGDAEQAADTAAAEALKAASPPESTAGTVQVGAGKKKSRKSLKGETAVQVSIVLGLAQMTELQHSLNDFSHININTNSSGTSRTRCKLCHANRAVVINQALHVYGCCSGRA